jgi:hypothetical protein
MIAAGSGTWPTSQPSQPSQLIAIIRSASERQFWAAARSLNDNRQVS